MYKGLQAKRGFGGKSFIINPATGEQFEKRITDDIEVSFDEYFFSDYLFKPRELGDTFEAFGRDWLVIEDKNLFLRSFTAMPETVRAHHTLMFRLKHYTDLTLFYISTWRLADPTRFYGLESIIEHHKKAGA